MNSFLLRVVGSFSLVALLSSCDLFFPSTELVFTEPFDCGNAEPRIVLQALMSPCHGVVVEVSPAQTADEYGIHRKLQDPSAALFEDGRFVANLHQRGRIIEDSAVLACKYDFYLRPEEAHISEGHSYSVKVEAAGFPSAVSQGCSLPAPLSVDSVVMLDDGASRWNRCMVFFQSSHDCMPICPFVQVFLKGRVINRFIVRPETLSFSGGSGDNSLAFDVDTWHPVFDSLRVEVLSLSPELHDYLVSMQDYILWCDDASVDHPNPIFCNVDGGYGFAGAYVADGVTLYADSPTPHVSEFFMEELNRRFEPSYLSR